MSKRSRRKKKGWKERLRERHIKYQKALESHQTRMEKKLTEKKSQKWRKSQIFLATCLLILILSVYAAWQYTKPPATSSQGQSSQQQTPESPSGVIYIWPDGRVDPSTAPITKVKENYYKFTGNVTLPIIVLKENIVIDGAGSFLKGDRTKGSRGIDLSYRKNVTVINLKIEGFDYGIYLDSTTNAVISNNELINNYCGVWLTSSSHNNITSNNISKNEGYGIWLKNSTNNFMTRNKITSHVANYTMYLGYSNNNTIQANIIANNKLGIFLYSSSNNTISHNNITQNYEGINLLNSTKNLITLNNITQNDIGISFSESSNNTISHNNITQNYEGINLLNSTKNLITLNNITQNDIGISFSESSNNTTHHNNFIDNLNHANVQNLTNIWDDGKEGNYWSDYKSKNPNAQELNGIWDTPYIIDGENRDRYPLTKPTS